MVFFNQFLHNWKSKSDCFSWSSSWSHHHVLSGHKSSEWLCLNWKETGYSHVSQPFFCCSGYWKVIQRHPLHISLCLGIFRIHSNIVRELLCTFVCSAQTSWVACRAYGFRVRGASRVASAAHRHKHRSRWQHSDRAPTGNRRGWFYPPKHLLRHVVEWTPEYPKWSCPAVTALGLWRKVIRRVRRRAN